MSTTYKVEVTRDGKWWMIAIPELGALTQARRIEDVPTLARELIALEAGVALADVAIEQRIELVAGERTSPRESASSATAAPVSAKKKHAYKRTWLSSPKNSPPPTCPSATSAPSSASHTNASANSSTTEPPKPHGRTRPRSSAATCGRAALDLTSI